MTINWHVALTPMETEAASERSASGQFYQRIFFIYVSCIALFL
jgi:hypothetical protein